MIDRVRRPPRRGAGPGARRAGAAGAAGAALIAALAGAPPDAAADAPPRLGVMADAGLPDGAMGSLVVRPWRALRLHAGGGYNGISRGVRAGAALVPLDAWISPTLSVDWGRYAEGDANPLARRLTGDPAYHATVLERVGYDFANAHVGLALGRRRATFFVQAGVTRIAGSVRGLEAVARGDAAAAPPASTSGASSVTFAEDPHVRAWSASARLGLIVYLVP